MDANDGNEVSNVSVMSEVDISEDLPSGDDSAFTNEEQQPVTAVSDLHTANDHDHVFVDASGGLLSSEQLHERIKTTHIVIHDQTLETGLKTPITPLTPATPLSTNSLKDPKFKYNWDESVHNLALPVRCKSSNGELHKIKFGSGNRGRCIKVGELWYTPSEFETACGRASSKDWKRSIRYGGRTLQCLIEEGILQPHATSCTCAACCDDVTVTGPVRLFVPYKRQRRDSKSDKRLQGSKSTKSGLPVSPSLSKDAVVVTLTNSPGLTQALSVNTSGSADTIHVVTPGTNLVDGSQVCEAIVMTPLQQTPKDNGGSMDFSEQKQWWHLEEMANNILNHVHQLKNLIEHAKQQSIAAKEVAIQQIKMQLENEKKEALNSIRIETQLHLQRAALGVHVNKEMSIQQAIAQARVEIKDTLDSVPESKNDIMKACANCDREAFSECTGCHRVSYCGSFCQRKDWPNHQNECGQNVIMDGEEDEEDEEDSDKDKD